MPARTRWVGLSVITVIKPPPHVIHRDAEPEPALPAGTDHDRSRNGLGEPELDMRVGPCWPARPVHFHWRQVDRSRDQRRSCRAKGHRFRQTCVTAPARDFDQIERAAALVDRRERRHPTAGAAEPTVRMGRERPRLVLSGSNGHVDAPTRQPPDGERRVTGPLACEEVAVRRHP